MGALIFVAGFFIVLAAVVVFAAMRRGSGTAIQTSEPSQDARRFTLATVIVVVVGVGLAVPVAISLTNEASGASKAPGGKQLTADEQKGRDIFGMKCGQCHTLADANAVGKVGPNLDVLRPQSGLTEDAVLQGRARGQGQMPRELVNGKDAKAVSDYVERVAGR